MLQVIRYKWAEGAPHRVDAATAAGVFETIRERDGVLTPDAIVAESQEPEAPLHGEFTWDDPTAAAAYRRDQAQAMIRHMVVVHRHPVTQAELPTRLYVSLNRITRAQAAAGQYAIVHDVLADDRHRAALLEQARLDLERWAAKYQHLQELAAVREMVGEALDALAAA